MKVLCNIGTDKRILFGFVHYLSILLSYTCLVKPMFGACFLLVEMDSDLISSHNAQFLLVERKPYLKSGCLGMVW